MISAVHSVRIDTFYGTKLKIVHGIYCLYHVDIIYGAYLLSLSDMLKYLATAKFLDNRSLCDMFSHLFCLTPVRLLFGQKIPWTRKFLVLKDVQGCKFDRNREQSFPRLDARAYHACHL